MEYLHDFLEHELIHFNQSLDVFRTKEQQKILDKNLTFFERVKKYGLGTTSYYSQIMEIEAGAYSTIRELYQAGFTKDNIYLVIKADLSPDFIPSTKYKQIYKTFFKNKPIWQLYLDSLKEYNDILENNVSENALNEILDPISAAVIITTLMFSTALFGGSAISKIKQDNYLNDIEKNILQKSLGKDYEKKIILIDEILKKRFDEKELHDIKFYMFNSDTLNDIRKEIIKEKNEQKRELLYKDAEKFIKSKLTNDQYNRLILCIKEMNDDNRIKYKYKI